MCDIWHLLVLFNLGVPGKADAVSGGHGEVRQEGEGGDEGSQDVEEAFLLHL